jgi:hypothetical protein
MEAINDENDFILTQRENRMMSHLIDAETVRWLVAEMLGPAAAMDGYGMIDGGVIDAEMMHATTATMAVDDHGEGNNSEGGYAARVKDASADLIEIMGRRDELTKRATELEISLDQLRAKFLLENSVRFTRRIIRPKPHTHTCMHVPFAHMIILVASLE